MAELVALKQALAEMTYDDRMVFATFIAEWLDAQDKDMYEAFSAAKIAEMLSYFYRGPAEEAPLPSIDNEIQVAKRGARERISTPAVEVDRRGLPINPLIPVGEEDGR